MPKSKSNIPKWVRTRKHLLKINFKLLNDEENQNDIDYKRQIVRKIWALKKLDKYYSAQKLNDNSVPKEMLLNTLAHKLISLQMHYLNLVELISGLDALLDK